jgi:hypothetical protein
MIPALKCASQLFDAVLIQRILAHYAVVIFSL